MRALGIGARGMAGDKMVFILSKLFNYVVAIHPSIHYACHASLISPPLFHTSLFFHNQTTQKFNFIPIFLFVNSIKFSSH